MTAYATRRRPPRTMTKTEQATLLKVTGEHARGYRDHVLFAVALGTGLRESELLALDVGDIAHRGKVRRRIVLRTFKRCTESPAPQEVFLPDALIYKLGRFLKWKAARGESTAVDAPLFVSRNGNRLSCRRARAAFQLWQERCALPRTLSFHSLRHCFCQNLYAETRDLRLVQRAARHVHVSTTTIYAHPSDEDLLCAVRELAC